ncbi:MAG: hypothetical protein PHQ04_09555 [Opitutaceae bacterium]|nr:hypothetical protein [Opitutaceae bacterium]
MRDKTGRIVIGLAVIGACFLLQVPDVHAQAGSDRFPQLTKESLNAEQQPVAAEILKQSRFAGLAGPWNPMLRSPEMAARLTKFLDYVRLRTSIPLRLNEFAILITARQWSAQYAWWAHTRIAREAGLAEAIMADLAQGRRPAAMQPDEAAVYDFCTELQRDHFVSDATFKRAKELLGEQQVVDLMAACGAYTMVSMLLNTAEVVPNDGSRPLAPLAPN